MIHDSTLTCTVDAEMNCLVEAEYFPRGYILQPESGLGNHLQNPSRGRGNLTPRGSD